MTIEKTGTLISLVPYRPGGSVILQAKDGSGDYLLIFVHSNDQYKISQWVNDPTVLVRVSGELVSEQQSHEYLNQINVDSIIKAEG